MEVPIEQQLEELFTKLKGQIDASKLKGALKTAEQILEIVPGDIDALKCKIVSLIQLERCPEALAACGATTEVQFEKAYCLYRLSKFDEALEICKSVQGEKSPRLLQLQAQILHRLDRAQECIAVYGELLQNQKTQSTSVGTNIVAAYIEGGRSAEVPALMQEIKLRTKDSFELAYNSARALSDVGDFEAAEEQLLLAQRLGKEVLLEEDMPEAEVEEELMPIAVQLAYIAAQQGRTAEALEAYTSLLKRKTQPESLSAVAVATNNLVALRGARDLFDSLKRFDRLMANPSATCSTFQAYLESKLSGKHKQSMLFNRCLLLLHSNKAAACKELSQVLAERFTSSDMPFLIQAALSLREKKGAQTKADDILSAFAAAHPDVASRVQLMRAQIAAAAGNWKRSIEALEAVPELAYRPAVVATLAALYEAATDIDGANKVLDTALEKLGSEANHSALSTVQLAAAAFKSANCWQKEAAALYEKLLQDGRNLDHPVIGVAGLVRATCSFDLDLAERHAQRLPRLAGEQDLEVEELEIGDGIQTTLSRRDGGAGARGEAGLKRAAREAGVDDEQGKEKKKRKRKPRLPKDFDPENPPPLPDPERWLPKHERQSFKKLSRNRKKQELNLKGGQGVSASEAKDAEAKLEAKKLEQPLEPETPPELSRPQTANKKKGKKGRR